MSATIEKRLRRLEDIEEIRSLLTAYGRLLDVRDLAGYAALFAVNGRWTGPYIGSAEGPAAIQALLEKNLKAVAGEEPAGAHHVMSNMVIDIRGDTASAWSRWTYIVPGDARKPTLALSGHYDDVLTRESGRWKFKSRLVSGDLPGVGVTSSEERMPLDLEQELRRLRDIEDIRRLLIEYGRTLDQRDFAAYSRLFAHDGEWVGVGTIGSAQGPAAIQAFMEKNIGVAPVRCNHLMTNMLIDVDGDSATAWSRWTLIDATETDTPALVYSGHYEDILTRESGRWKFRKRTAWVDIPNVSHPSSIQQR